MQFLKPKSFQDFLICFIDVSKTLGCFKSLVQKIRLSIYEHCSIQINGCNTTDTEKV